MIDAEFPVVDFAVHVYPESVQTPEDRENPLYQVVGDLLTDADEIEAALDRAGVDVAVLSSPQFMGHPDADAAREANDALLDIVETSDRFLGLASIPTAAGGDAAAAELERCLDAGFNGGALETRSEGVRLTDPDVEPVFEVADDHGAPLLVHPELHESLSPDALDDTRFYNAVYGREVALATAVHDVVFDGVLDRYPDLDLVFHHFGGNIASMLGRVFVHTHAPRWPFKDELVDFDAFQRGMERVHVDTSGYFDFRGPFRAALETFPDGHVVFATDLPFEARHGADIARYVDAVRDVAPGNRARRVLGRNALDLLVNVE